MGRHYEVLCRNAMADPCFRGLESSVRRIKTLVSDLKPGTQYNYIKTLKKYVEFAKRRGVADPLRFDEVLVKDFLSGYKATTRSNYAFRLRKIFVLNGEVANFKVKAVDNELPETLSDGEVETIVEGTRDMKWRTLFRLTYEGALREHEVLNMQIKHVRFDKFGAEVYVPSTKSQPLWLRVIDSTPLLQSWLEMHPRRKDREAWIFLGRDPDKPLTFIAFYLALKRVAKRVGVEKRVFPHLLRHSRLAWLKKHGAKLGISDSVICKLYGRWSRKNAHRMLDRYGRIEPEEANEIILRAYNRLGEEKVVEPLSKPRSCPRCKVENDALAKYCRVCSMVLDEAEAVKIVEEREGLRREVADLKRKLAVLDDPVLLEALRALKRKQE